MGKIIELTHDDVQNELAYALICETMEGAYWNSGRRRRMFSKAFTRSEQQRISNIKAKAHKWYLVTGVPEKGTHELRQLLALAAPCELLCSYLSISNTIQWAFLLGRPIFTCMFVRTE